MLLHTNSCKRQRLKEGKFNDIEIILVKWFHQARASSIPCDGPVLKEKALQIAKQLNVQQFTASNGWLDRFKVRHGVIYWQINGEAKSVNENDVNRWLHSTLPTVLLPYSPADIYNADKLGLFFKMLPDRSYVFKDDPCIGGKQSKERLSVLLCSNTTGTHKLVPLVIGKSARPQCFKNVEKLPCSYSNQKSAWMTAYQFQNWLKDVNEEMFFFKLIYYL